MNSAVLFLVFNRPKPTYSVFEKIRRARPPRLYIAADGPRAEKIGESILCAEVRSITQAIDWPCDVQTLYRDQNLGCKFAVSSAISWFFQHESEGIILEDDCEPAATFFDYCDELLCRFRHEEKVASISGSTFIPSADIRGSYFFSRYADIWGWATWRRSWQFYDVEMRDWPKWRDMGRLKSFSEGDVRFEQAWRDTFNRTYLDQVDTWDFQWQFSCWLRGAVGVVPRTNLIQNLGFSPDATHTNHEAPRFVREVQDLAFPLQHPSEIRVNRARDSKIGKRRYDLTYSRLIRNALLKVTTARKIFEHFRRRRLGRLSGGGRM